MPLPFFHITACDIQIDGRRGAGRPKLTWKRLAEKDSREWKLITVDPQERRTWTEMPTIHIFFGIVPIFKADFCITIANVKITCMANINSKMVPDKMMGVTPTSTQVIPYHP